ncbi:MAG TPA: AI-2E family transporter, partial [Verrucomicrobiota bacterium]|nr:AI-2E family transporter [Verrucomicrobiota bacterium]
MPKSQRISYVIMAVLLVLVGMFHLGTLVLTAFFGYFALQQFSLGKSKTLAVIVYLVAVVAIGYGLFFFSKRAYVTLPVIAKNTIPAVVDWAEKQNIELPFADYASLKSVTIKEVQDRLGNLGRYAYEAFFQFALLVIGLVVALSLFLNTRWGTDDDPHEPRDSLYATVVRELVVRFETFFSSFSRVIGAQIAISAINAVLTAIYLVWNGFPWVMVLIFLTFLCGLLPIIGNIISNTLIVGVAFTISPSMALWSLVFLVVIHKLEYFLNARIVGSMIRAKAWELLCAMLVMESAFGLAGLVIAPICYAWLKDELSQRGLI